MVRRIIYSLGSVVFMVCILSRIAFAQGFAEIGNTSVGAVENRPWNLTDLLLMESENNNFGREFSLADAFEDNEESGDFDFGGDGFDIEEFRASLEKLEEERMKAIVAFRELMEEFRENMRSLTESLMAAIQENEMSGDEIAEAFGGLFAGLQEITTELFSDGFGFMGAVPGIDGDAVGIGEEGFADAGTEVTQPGIQQGFAERGEANGADWRDMIAERTEQNNQLREEMQNQFAAFRENMQQFRDNMRTLFSERREEMQQLREEFRGTLTEMEPGSEGVREAVTEFVTAMREIMNEFRTQMMALVQEHREAMAELIENFRAGLQENGMQEAGWGLAEMPEPDFNFAEMPEQNWGFAERPEQNWGFAERPAEENWGFAERPAEENWGFAAAEGRSTGTMWGASRGAASVTGGSRFTGATWEGAARGFDTSRSRTAGTTWGGAARGFDTSRSRTAGTTWGGAARGFDTSRSRSAGATWETNRDFDASRSRESTVSSQSFSEVRQAGNVNSNEGTFRTFMQLGGDNRNLRFDNNRRQTGSMSFSR